MYIKFQQHMSKESEEDYNYENHKHLSKNYEKTDRYIICN